MENVRNPTNLQRRRQRWYLRLKVPAELREIVGRHEIVRSLKTGDKTVAIQRLPLAMAQANADIAAARRKLGQGPGDSMDEFEIQQAVLRWFARAEGKAVMAPPAEDVGEAHDTAVVDLATLSDPTNPAVISWVDDIAAQIMTQAHVDLDPTGDDHARLTETIRQALIEQTRRRQARLHGDFAAAFDARFKGAVATVPETVKAEPQGVTLGELCTLYIGDPRRAKLAPKSRLDTDVAIRLIKAIMGADTPARTISRDDCRRFRDIICALPPNFTKRFPGMSPEKAVEAGKKRRLAPMAPRTAGQYLGRLSAIMRWAEREEYIDRNPAGALHVFEADVNGEDGRHSFSTEELNKLFAQPLYRGCQDDEAGYDKPGPYVIKRYRYWMLPIALFTGMRMNEVVSLRTDDIEQRDGVWCFVVRPGEGKRLKTKNAARTIPVHPMLVAMGLLEYRDKVAGKKPGWLFPEVPTDARGYRSDAPSKWFVRFQRKAGVNRDRVTFHSSRHAFRDQLREIGAPRDIVLALGGWAGAGVADSYGSGPSPKVLAKWVRKIIYPGVNIENLHRGATKQTRRRRKP